MESFSANPSATPFLPESAAELQAGRADDRQSCARADGSCGVCQGLTAKRVLRSEDLFAGERELFIIHQDQVYRLLCTKNDRLILQK